jgi:hypothetical protein
MAENAYAITIENSEDALVRSQYLDTFRRSELEPEKSLLAAILEDAVQEYRKYNGAHDPKSKSRFRDVEEWFNRRDREWIFSFDNVCELLCLDPEYVRRRLPEAQGKAAEKDKQPVHHHGVHKRAA